MTSPVTASVAHRRGIGFTLTEEQEAVRAMVRDFARTEIAPRVKEWDEAQVFPREVLAKLGELGMLQVHLRVYQVGQSLNVIWVVVQLGLKLACCLRILLLDPQQVAQAVVCVGFLGISLDRCAELLNGAGGIFLLIQRLAGQHIGLG